MKRDSANRRVRRKNKSPETRTALPETNRGIPVSVDRDELPGLMQESLAALAVGLRRRVASAILEDEVTRLCGARYQRQPGRSHTRYGHQKGMVRLGGQKHVADQPLADLGDINTIINLLNGFGVERHAPRLPDPACDSMTH